MVRDFRDALPGQDLAGLSDGSRLEVLHQLEIASRTMAAVTVQLQMAFYASQVAAQAQAGVRKSQRGKAVPDDLATARMCSPYISSRELTAAKALCTQLPHTLGALVAGVISGYQARLVAEGTSCVDAEHRAEVDERLASQLAGMSNRELQSAVQALVYEVDPEGFVARARKAAEDRGVSMRPMPDVMALLSARLPAPQAIAVYRSLDYAARVKKLGGDPRTLDQLRADELYERCTGKQVVDGIDVEVCLVITDTALFEGTSDPAELIDYGPVPADYAREILRPGQRDREDTCTNPAPAAGVTGPADEPAGDGADDARRSGDSNANGFPGGRAPQGYCPTGGTCTDPACVLIHGTPATRRAPQVQSDTGARSRSHSEDRTKEARMRALTAGMRAAKVFIRRLYTDPTTGVLVGRDTRRRLFTGSLRAFLVARDRTCRNPYCGAQIRAIDHIRRHADGGETTEENGQGLCERCNLARERPRTLTPRADTYRPPPPLLPCFPRPTRPARPTQDHPTHPGPQPRPGHPPPADDVADGPRVR